MDDHNNITDMQSLYTNITTDFSYLRNQPNDLLQPHNIVITCLAVIGICANVIGIVSLMRHRSSNRDCTRSRKILLLSLSASDIATCMFIPLRTYVRYALDHSQLFYESRLSYYCTITFLDLLIPACQTISLLNLLGMAIDHLIMFLKPFRYFEMMSHKRTVIMVLCFWVFSFVVAFCEYLSALKFINADDYQPDLFCQLAKMDPSFHPNYQLLLVAPICLIAMIGIYVSISREINKLVCPPPRQQDFGQARRALYTTYVILLTFLVCWLPCFILTSTLLIDAWLQEYRVREVSMFDFESFRDIAIIHNWLFALLVFNSILDPVIYISHLRLKVTSFCDSFINSANLKYSIVETTEAQIHPGRTISLTRSSVQFTMIPNTTLCDRSPV